MPDQAYRKLIWPLLIWILILCLNFFFTPGFFQIVVKNGHLYGSMIDIFVRGTPVMLISLGMTLVIATGGVDLSVGAITAISGAVAAVLFQAGYTDPFVVSAIALGAGLLCGAWNALLVAGLEVQPIVATLVLMVAGRGIAQLLTGGQIIAIEHAVFHEFGSGHFLGIPIGFYAVVATGIFTALLCRKTAMGLFIEAVGNNPVASRYVGMNTRMVKGFTYLFCGFCSGLAGLIIASNISAADASNSGLYLELDAILAVVIGGTALQGGRFSLLGSLLGVLIIQTVVTTINTRGVPAEYTLIIKAVVVLTVCLFQSSAFRNRFEFLKKSARGKPA